MWRKLNEKWKDICSFININHYNYFITDCFRSWKWHIFQNDSRFKICRSNAYHVPYAFTYSGIGILCGRFQTKNILFPVKFSKGYIIATCLVGILYITAPANYIDGFPAIMVLIYSSIVTPIYEELLFRGIIWSLFEESTSNLVTVFAWNVVLFTIWHIGYMVPNILSGNWNAVIWKLAAGLGYGVVLSLLRLKTKTCYATVLAHGVLNLFMI